MWGLQSEQEEKGAAGIPVQDKMGSIPLEGRWTAVGHALGGEPREKQSKRKKNQFLLPADGPEHGASKDGWAQLHPLRRRPREQAADRTVFLGWGLHGPGDSGEGA